jgi:hypothetical protein
MDVVAFEPERKTVVHLETSFDADSWEKRRRKFHKKFEIAPGHYRSVFRNFNFETVRKVAVVGLTKPRKVVNFDDDIDVLSIQELMREIIQGIPADPLKKAVPESYPLLRSLQFAAWYFKSRRPSLGRAG